MNVGLVSHSSSSMMPMSVSAGGRIGVSPDMPWPSTMILSQIYSLLLVELMGLVFRIEF